jgi:hypothetical protein
MYPGAAPATAIESRMDIRAFGSSHAPRVPGGPLVRSKIGKNDAFALTVATSRAAASDRPRIRR